MDAGELGESFTHKLGPLPVWAWVVVGGGGLWLWERHRGSSAAPIQDSTTSTDAGNTGDNSGMGSGESIPSGGSGADIYSSGLGAEFDQLNAQLGGIAGSLATIAANPVTSGGASQQAVDENSAAANASQMAHPTVHAAAKNPHSPKPKAKPSHVVKHAKAPATRTTVAHPPKPGEHWKPGVGYVKNEPKPAVHPKPKPKPKPKKK